MDKFELQDALYRFPYHYIPDIATSAGPVRYKLLDWGYEYLCYMLHVVSLVERLAPESLLDVGCGDGRLISLIDSNTVRTRVGVDLSSTAIVHARLLNPDWTFICDDVATVDGLYDAVCAIEVLEHIPDSELNGFLTASVSKLKPGGHLIISVPTTNVPLNRKHFRHYTLPLLLDQLSPARRGLTLTSTEYVFNRNNHGYRFWKRLTSNRHWFLAVKRIERVVWQHVWTRMRFADEYTGAHLVVVLQKE